MENIRIKSGNYLVFDGKGEKMFEVEAETGMEAIANAKPFFAERAMIHAIKIPAEVDIIKKPMPKKQEVNVPDVFKNKKHSKLCSIVSNLIPKNI